MNAILTTGLVAAAIVLTSICYADTSADARIYIRIKFIDVVRINEDNKLIT